SADDALDRRLPLLQHVDGPGQRHAARPAAAKHEIQSRGHDQSPLMHHRSPASGYSMKAPSTCRQSLRSAGKSGARNVARTAQRPASNPDSTIKLRRAISRGHGSEPPAERCGTTDARAAKMPISNPYSTSRPFSANTKTPNARLR